MTKTEEKIVISALCYVWFLGWSAPTHKSMQSDVKAIMGVLKKKVQKEVTK
jgi:hypothetical protein